MGPNKWSLAIGKKTPLYFVMSVKYVPKSNNNADYEVTVKYEGVKLKDDLQKVFGAAPKDGKWLLNQRLIEAHLKNITWNEDYISICINRLCDLNEKYTSPGIERLNKMNDKQLLHELKDKEHLKYVNSMAEHCEQAKNVDKKQKKEAKEYLKNERKGLDDLKIAVENVKTEFKTVGAVLKDIKSPLQYHIIMKIDDKEFDLYTTEKLTDEKKPAL